MTSAGSFEPIHRLQERSLPSVASDSGSASLAKRSPPSSKESRSPKRSRLPSPTQASQQVSVAVITQYEGTDVAPATIFKQPHWDDSAAEVLALKRIAVAEFISLPGRAALRAALAAISDEKKKIIKGPAVLGLPLKALVDTEQLPPFLLVVFLRCDSNSTVPDTPASAILAQQIVPNDILNGAHSPVIKHGGEALPLETQYEPFADTTRGLRRQLKDDELLAEVQRLHGDSWVNAKDRAYDLTEVVNKYRHRPSEKWRLKTAVLKLLNCEGGNMNLKVHGRLDLLPADVFLKINAGFKGRAAQKFSLLHQTLQVDYFPTYPALVLELWDHTLAIGYYYQRDGVFQYRDAHMVDLLVPGTSGMPNDRHTSEVAYYFGLLRQLLNKIANHLKKKNPPHEYEPLVDDVLKVTIDGKPVQLQYVEAFRPDDPRIFKVKTVVMESPATERTTYYVAKLLSEPWYGKDAQEYFAELGFAPRLHYHGPVEIKGDALRMGFYIVIMDYVDSTAPFSTISVISTLALTLRACATSCQAQQGRKIFVKRLMLPPEQMEDHHVDNIREVAKLLQAGRWPWLHGDLRPENIVFRPGQKLQILDWDWAGKDGGLIDPRYPPTLNDCSIVPRHPRARAKGDIRTSHDIWHLNRMLLLAKREVLAGPGDKFTSL
ncbi:hypothetical protein FB45DRAFT_1039166 [Roridomyces roridus]|uniref:Aminoglycoside phosphotransferase domain-containing protein n=1 Tax=Roridomyces roridus TaxID=1738132 RepID=A0AAD7B3L6_9AGAR|nr:hypothetical protein FB45DRAFT_1039166 [Roridomyces roridus]